ncbi:peptidoglycan DD-metalloendopeptidase family protein [Patescibacteria group bacterium]|nr:peptidoglycan DD-metalloendopeptidase family protein [Patescibacteria group bacterium]
MKKFLFKFLLAVLITTLGMPNFVHADLLEDKKIELHNLQKKIDEQEAALSKVRNQTLTLGNQVKLLDQQTEAARLMLEKISAQIDEIGIEKTFINRDLVDLEEDALEQKIVLQQALRLSYIKKQRGLLEILLSSKNLSELLSYIQYLNQIQNRISSGIKNMNELQKDLAVKKSLLQDKDARLAEIRSDKAVEEQSLQIQLDAKDKIMKGLKLSEAEYQSKLDASRTEQQAVSNEIAALIKSTDKGKTYSGELVLNWPIGSRLITATFQDPDYKRRFGIAHNGLDIATPQGTPIKSPADGTVTNVKDGGMGLSYIIVSHNSGLSTTYLHVSGFAVSKGAYVAQGQVLGYTGGTPGTPGAGWLTTGPHLHMEVWYQGTARNPLAYLVG